MSNIVEMRNTLRKGSSGEDVRYLQQILSELGYSVAVDGNFGQQTHDAVCRFQKEANLGVDGVVGKMTWTALEGAVPTNFAIERAKIATAINFEKAANMLDVEVAAIRAVHQVEAGGRSGFLPDGRPMILFEGHSFWGQLKKKGMEPATFQAGNEDILFPEWNQKSYKGGTAEYHRLNRA